MLVFAVLLHTGAEAAEKQAARLDKAKVMRLYNDGDFDPAIAILEGFEKRHSRFTREESVTVYKYLGVMYSASPDSREKGKTYFYKLLKVDPNAKILDMYVSIVVQEIFKNTLEELMDQGNGINTHQSPISARPEPRAFLEDRLQEPASKQPEKREPAVRRSHSALWWIGGVGLAAGIAGGYIWYANNRSSAPSRDSNIVINP